MLISNSPPGHIRGLALSVANILTAVGLALASMSPVAALAATLPDATAYSWGYAANGDMGTGLVVGPQNTPTAVSKIGHITTAVAAGNYHGLALATDGSVYAWGDNGFGQLGFAPMYPFYTSTPQQVPGLSNVTAIAAGGNHSLALKSDGSVWAWGSNVSGELGNGPTGLCNPWPGYGPCSPTPVQVHTSPGAALSSVKAIAAGSTFSMALRTDGTVWAWGSNVNGQLGNGTGATIPFSNVATQVLSTSGGSPLGGITAIAAGANHALALQPGTSTAAVATVFGWGNTAGVVGVTRPPCAQVYSTVACADKPQIVLTYTGLTAIGAGGDHSLAVAGGQVLAWGWNLSGELGDGTQINRSSPVLLSGISGVKSVAGGMYHSLALMNDGTVQAWGDPFAIGMSCSGTACQASLKPTQVPGLSGIASVSAGTNLNLTVTTLTVRICICTPFPTPPQISPYLQPPPQP